MKKNLTELVFVMDMSGSMGHLTDDTIGYSVSLHNEIIVLWRETTFIQFIFNCII